MKSKDMKKQREGKAMGRKSKDKEKQRD